MIQGRFHLLFVFVELYSYVGSLYVHLLNIMSFMGFFEWK